MNRSGFFKTLCAPLIAIFSTKTLAGKVTSGKRSEVKIFVKRKDGISEWGMARVWENTEYDITMENGKHKYVESGKRWLYVEML